MPEQPSAFFDDVAATVLTQPGVSPGTMMGFPCLRASGKFFASCDHRTGDLIVKLPRGRVEELIDAGVGKPFAPAGRTFREWVLVDDRNETRWAALMDEALLFANSQQ
ncbi:MAG: hypothetical protein K0U84_12590 [Actinomycetia bacterium]|nr:hypothetical protein [Actinomycetes bacterium]